MSNSQKFSVVREQLLHPKSHRITMNSTEHNLSTSLPIQQRSLGR